MIRHIMPGEDSDFQKDRFQHAPPERLPLLHMHTA